VSEQATDKPGVWSPEPEEIKPTDLLLCAFSDTSSLKFYILPENMQARIARQHGELPAFRARCLLRGELTSEPVMSDPRA